MKLFALTLIVGLTATVSACGINLYSEEECQGDVTTIDADGTTCHVLAPRPHRGNGNGNKPHRRGNSMVLSDNGDGTGTRTTFRSEDCSGEGHDRVISFDGDCQKSGGKGTVDGIEFLSRSATC